MTSNNLDPLQLGETSAILKTDAMPEAGRKIFHTNFKQMLVHQAELYGPATVHNVHQMRVTTRKMRSALRLFMPYYKSKNIRIIKEGLRTTAHALGAVRDLDVLTENLMLYAQKHDLHWELLFVHLGQHRANAFALLDQWLQSADYAKFLNEFTQFVTTPGKHSILAPDSRAIPFSVRHVVTVLLYQQNANVLTYDLLFPSEDPETLHNCRIACKGLRYLLNFFDGLLGANAKAYHNEVKAIQDYLGLLNDAVVAHERLGSPDLFTVEEIAQLAPYREELRDTANKLMKGFPLKWRHFMTRRVQEHLASSVLVLR